VAGGVAGKLNVLADYVGHSDLYYSLHLLFEKRLGYQLYFPEGPEWQTRGFVEFPSPPVTVGKIDTANDVKLNPYVECWKDEVVDGVHCYHRKMEPDRGHWIQRAITFDKFMHMDFDVVLTTYFGHEKTFHTLVEKHKPSALFIRQIGNMHERPLGFAKNILLGSYHPSVHTDVVLREISHVKYMPEQYEGYTHTPPANHTLVKSFAPHLQSYTKDFEAWNTWKNTLTDFTFKLYGDGDTDEYPYGFVPHLLYPQALRDTGFVWYTKGHGGGGFTVRQALASGRPVIIRKHYVASNNVLEERLFEHGVNCIDLDAVGFEDAARLLKEWSQPDRHVKVCQATAEKFGRDINFKQEASQVRAWIESLRRN
jgi:glycosyltransferase involved in cell wall biosynthesis